VKSNHQVDTITLPFLPILISIQLPLQQAQNTMSASSTTNKAIKRTILQAIPIPSLPGWESRLVLLEYPPGVSAPVHTHPVASTGYVIEGKVLSQWEGSNEVEYYGPGDSFVDHGERVHSRSENVGEGWLRFVASYVIKVGDANVKIAE
jgi:quercetin dioxygenase-like cupin family protein